MVRWAQNTTGDIVEIKIEVVFWRKVAEGGKVALYARRLCQRRVRLGESYVRLTLLRSSRRGIVVVNRE